MRNWRKTAAAVALLAQIVPSAGEEAEKWSWNLPSFLPPPRVPADNPMSEARFQLGRTLFYDTRLSGNGKESCASCHLQERAFTDGRKVAIGSTGEQTPRNSPSIANAAWRATLTWANPAMVTLERQMEGPLFGEGPVEMGVNDANRGEIVARFKSDESYRRAFARAFPNEAEPISFGNIIKAIAAFERGVISTGSKYDLYLEGKASLTPEETRGKDLFFGEKAECHHCHGSVNFDDQFYHAGTREIETPFHNTGMYNLSGKGDYPAPNRGLFESTHALDDMGKFRAPSLRNIAVTGPYMHDGSVATLEDVVDLYAAGGRDVASGPLAGDGRVNPHKSDLIVPIDLSPQEKSDLIAFLKTLTDEEFLRSPRYSNPWAGNDASIAKTSSNLNSR
ncbi:methanobactin export MATE transporter MbnM [Methylocystis parvus]|uniref:Di-heme enzyme n=1 Tax=Methylocystis parvus TaxID=134 RepID=A0A6B8M7F2_9HYPH|nr:methanobactin export MATE transporter MbnM [Methylocystis parvus]QGM98416.1 di-heme enzyme [Methylocystis parvus]WBK01250.1 di-heme enzyme [Methylocystis parvus OBBP]